MLNGFVYRVNGYSHVQLFRLLPNDKELFFLYSNVLILRLLYPDKIRILAFVDLHTILYSSLYHYQSMLAVSLSYRRIF